MQPSADHEPHVEGTIWMRDLDELPVEVSPLVPAVFGPLGLERSAQLAEAMHSTLEELHQRFSGGRRCCGVWVEDHLASYGWISFEEEFVGELRLRLKLLPGEAYIWDCATLPAYRQQHLYSALLAYMLAQLRQEPLCRVWIGADQVNQVSQRGMQRAGFHHVADLVISRVVARRLAWVQGQPDVPESLVAEARRVFLDSRDQVWLNSLASPVGE
jgi:ribosomal protein S18 acetylase RimI-like enzyme